MSPFIMKFETILILGGGQLMSNTNNKNLSLDKSKIIEALLNQQIFNRRKLSII